MFTPLPYGDPDLARVLVLVAHHEGRRDAVGSAVMVLPGLALTALHVITEPLRVYRGELLEEGREHKLDAKFDMNALTPHADGTFTEWRIRQASSSRHSDIAWLQMDTAGRVPDLPPIRLTLIPPRRESAVVAFGYPGAQVMIGEKRIEVAAQPVRSTGRTAEVHGQFRDRRRLRYPCFHTNARFDDGMSGGPVFDQSGTLCGLVSVGYDLAPEEAGVPISYAALLWPALATELGLPPFEGHHVRDLAASGTLQVEGWQRFAFGEGRDIVFDATGIVED